MWLKLSLVLAILLVVGCKLYSVAQLNGKDSSIKEEFKQLHQELRQLRDQVSDATRSAYLRRYLNFKGSPLVHYYYDVFRTASLYNLNPSHLLALAIAESGGCKEYIRSTNNCWGWGNGRTTFISITEGIREVGRSLGRGSAYRNYQKDGTLKELAFVYNRGNWQAYEQVLALYVGEIESFK